MACSELFLVRHGESIGNVARHRAWDAGAEVIELGGRDADVPLTDRGREQARALGRFLATLPADRAPDAVWSSPFVRARDTARIVCADAGLTLETRVDERLRDRELGILDGLTGRGIAARFPAEAVRKRALGKFYHRPPGGESWTDVALRVRSLLRDVDDEEPGRRVLVVAHDAVVLLIRYVYEHLAEAELLEISRTTPVANASLTRLTRSAADGRWSLASYNVTSHLDDANDAEGVGRLDHETASSPI